MAAADCHAETGGWVIGQPAFESSQAARQFEPGHQAAIHIIRQIFQNIRGQIEVKQIAAHAIITGSVSYIRNLELSPAIDQSYIKSAAAPVYHERPFLKCRFCAVVAESPACSLWF